MPKATRRPARNTKTSPPPTTRVDRFKRFHLAVALAPTFAAKFFRDLDAIGGWRTHAEMATSLVQMADAIARRLELD